MHSCQLSYFLQGKIYIEPEIFNKLNQISTYKNKQHFIKKNSWLKISLFNLGKTGKLAAMNM